MLRIHLLVRENRPFSAHWHSSQKHGLLVHSGANLKQPPEGASSTNDLLNHRFIPEATYQKPPIYDDGDQYSFRNGVHQRTERTSSDTLYSVYSLATFECSLGAIACRLFGGLFGLQSLESFSHLEALG